ncbi:MAG: TasA family protein [Bacillota bacterium]
MKRLLLSALVLFLAIGTAGTGTFAYFQDTEASTGNIFTAGTMDLKIKAGLPWEGDYTDGVTATWTLSDMKPGDETPSKYVSFQNSGSVAADHLKITCDYEINEGTAVESETNSGNTADELAAEMVITEMRYYNRDYTWRVDLLSDDDYDSDYQVSPGESGPKVADLDGDGKVSLYELKSQGGMKLRPSGETRLKMKIRFDENAGNEFQGDTLNLTVYFTLNQDPSQ